MPKYHFDIADDELSRDIFGTELADDAAACEQAVIFAGTYLADHPKLVTNKRELRIIVKRPAQTIMTVIVLAVCN